MTIQPLARGLDSLYASAVALEAIYQPSAGGDPLSVRVIRRTAAAARDWSPTGPPRDQVVFAVRSSEVAAPVEGDQLTVAGQTWRVANAERHPHVPEWALEVETAVA